MKVCNAFSLSMLPEFSGGIECRAVTLDEARNLVAGGAESAIGHADTARIVSGLLGVQIPANRVSVMLAVGETVLVAQYSGPRLPEWATTLPEGAELAFVRVTRTH